MLIVNVNLNCEVNFWCYFIAIGKYCIMNKKMLRTLIIDLYTMYMPKGFAHVHSYHIQGGSPAKK